MTVELGSIFNYKWHNYISGYIQFDFWTKTDFESGLGLMRTTSFRRAERIFGRNGLNNGGGSSSRGRT